MRYTPINPDLFVQNRKRLVEKLKPGSIAIFNSNDIQPTNADGTFPFVQNTDLFYLTGTDQEETILLLSPDAADPKHREILFIKETNETIAIWQGAKYTKQQASEISGIWTVCWISEFEHLFRELILACKRVYLNTNEHARADVQVETRDARFVKWCMAAYPLHKYMRLAPIMHDLRAIKSDIEVDLIRQACGITEKTFRRILGFVRPGVWEFEVEAEMVHEFLKNRSMGPAYASIVASGKNACVLHYVKNNCQCQAGDLVLMDFGAEYAHYASDVTRTIPVSGGFTQRQKAVYNAVLSIQRAATDMLRPGNTLEIYNKEVGRLVEEELLQLNLLDARAIKEQTEDKPAYKRYFMHGVSHFLGLDVHDYGTRRRPFEAGMVFTCEPGIYIPEEAIGIRLENNILITHNGPIDLTKDIPIEADEIEALMPCKMMKDEGMG